MDKSLRNGTMLAYAAPMVPIWMLHTPALSVLPGLYAALGGVSLAAIGTILVFSRVLDGLTDPLIGAMSDRTNSRIGHRKPWIIAGAFLCAIGVWFWFRPGPETGAIYFLLSSIAVYIGWTMVEIPHGAWLSELADDYDERSRLSGFRTTAIYLGYVVFWLGPFLPMFDSTELTAEVTALLSYVVIGLLAITVLWAVLKVPEGINARPSKVNLKDAWQGLLKNKPLRVFTAMLLSSWIASGMVAGLYFFFITNYLVIPDKFGHIGLSVAAISFASASFWAWLARRIGKHRLLAICNFSVVITLLGMALIRPGPTAFPAMLVVFSLSAMFGSGSTVANYALMADIVDYDTLKTGHNSAGNYYALITLFQKVGLGAGAGLALFIAALFGFDAQESNEGTALVGFFIAFLAIPIILNLLATALAIVFPINRRRHQVIRKRLDQRALRESGVTSG